MTVTGKHDERPLEIEANLILDAVAYRYFDQAAADWTSTGALR